MTTRRLVTLFGALLAAFSIVLGRLFVLAQNREYADTAQAQTVTTLPLAYSRGNLYDCKGRNLTAYGVEYYALSIPGESSYSRLFNYVPYAQQSLLCRWGRTSPTRASTPMLFRDDTFPSLWRRIWWVM